MDHSKNLPAVRGKTTAPCDAVILNPLSAEETDMRTLIYAVAFAPALRKGVMSVDGFNQRVRSGVNKRPQLFALNGRQV